MRVQHDYFYTAGLKVPNKTLIWMDNYCCEDIYELNVNYTKLAIQ